jgi:class 3 adenylate cyclase
MERQGRSLAGRIDDSAAEAPRQRGVVGYSRLAGTTRSAPCLASARDPAIAADHVRIVKRTGDGSIVEFRSVVDSVPCAIEMQAGMVERIVVCPRRASHQRRIVKYGVAGFSFGRWRFPRIWQPRTSQPGAP